ncbi:hypothetical protein EDD85DRAFT_798597 [Armillaria nabsnona]|nr:hypothetical protein EDD85DRAFT_798597 [Armillaria nabsnona]
MSLRRTVLISIAVLLGTVAADTTYGADTLNARSLVLKLMVIHADAIVVGAGPAGIIVAERLAGAGESVLLLERGIASLYTSGGDRIEPWNYTITVFDLPGNGYQLSQLDDTSFYCTDTASTAGCILGGGGMVNAMMWVPPNSVDFENFPAGWNWDDVSASADKLYERNPGTTCPSADGVYYDTAVWDLASTFLSDNGWKQNSQRAGPVMTYLPLAKALDNFELKLSTLVTRVVRSGSTITGVEVETDSGREIININDGGKVILTAGALSTPRLLFNSGIGPFDQIYVVQAGSTNITLPDEMTVDSTAEFTVYNYTPINSMEVNATDAALYNEQGGILAQSAQRLAFWTNFETNETTRYIQGTVGPKSANTINWKIYLTHGLTSSGRLGILPNGTTTLLESPWLTTEDDKATITSFMETFIGYFDNQTVLSISADSVTAEGLTETYTTGAHWAASCAMGDSNDGSSVVDTDTKVWGTDNLFTADASIHPDLPIGNIQATIMVVAEKAAEKIIACN